MIEKYKLHILSFLFFSLSLVSALILQSSFWPEVFGTQVIPQFWLIISAYFCVYKGPVKAVVMIYFISIFFAGASAISFGKILCFNSVIYIISWILSPFNLKDIKVFILFCGASTLILPFIDIILSAVIAVQPFHTYSIFSWAAAAALTAIFSAAGLLLFLKFDSWINKLNSQGKD